MIQSRKPDEWAPEEDDITSLSNVYDGQLQCDEETEILMELEAVPESLDGGIPSDVKMIAVAVDNNDEPMLFAENVGDEIIPVVDKEYEKNDTLESCSSDSKHPIANTVLTEYHSDLNYQTETCSSSNESVSSAATIEKKGRKRSRNCKKWKNNIRKTKKAAGEEYVSAKQKVIPAKSMKLPCGVDCKKKCTLNISSDDRASIYSQFWSSELLVDQKRQFIAGCIEEVPVQRVRTRTGSRAGKRKYSLRYFFTVNGKKISVCRTFFINTLSISQTSIRFALTKRLSSGVVIPDQRGKHEPPNKIGPEVRNIIREHIQKFPCVDSHYSRNKSQRRYLGSHLSISKMYQCFYEECIEKKLSQAEIPKQWLYADIFNTEFNLSFKEPDNDTCDTCDEFLIKLKDAGSVEERNELQKKYEAHLLDADNRYKYKRKDKEGARAQPGIKMITVDLQKCLATPLLKNCQSFYSLKLWTFNYTIYDATDKSADCFVWDESVAGRGGNEMASCMMRYILDLPNSIERIIIWSDNCPSQNRNQQMIMCYSYLLMMKPSLKCIEHKFLLRGHTHMEADTVHARIEKQIKSLPQFQICTPWDWQQLIRLCGPNIAVKEMETDNFKNFNDLQGCIFQSKKKTVTNQTFFVSKVVHMKFLAETPGVMHFKTKFCQENFEQIDYHRVNRRSTRQLNNPSTSSLPTLLPIRNDPKPISTKKYTDLQKLLKWVPQRFHGYYKNLRHEAVHEDD
ncbi:unnamed protein product [Acanthoscelides obtectus]|uniref:DUF7869 domain-containing protein n=1 Tax=Acanthoscelides obtectus TaxID=200917 RepID=A0A9P0JQ20_ACAOB|nr:unnamed protein product [Acanthoscelides obtectus]CAK1679277.1 hypothetical protein AOBTE_LOCUS32196 [Acanthoscelides obtectus]